MQRGLIINNISNLYQVQVGDEIIECNVRGKLKQEDISPVVGDIVEIELLENEKSKGIIDNIIPRNVYLKRPKMANLTQIIFVVSLKSPKPDLLLLDKQLVYAEYLNINPIICINKIDLGREEDCKNITKLYQDIGYKVMNTNAKERLGIKELQKLLENNVTAFSGNSGVGKSTLINAIFEENITEEGDISQKNKRGKNTTTNVKLYSLGKDKYIADTPGFSTFDITEIESNDLDKYFIEFERYVPNCEYIGCNHIKEQNCGIKQALSENEISQERYERYCKIYDYLKDKEDHKW